ncbi:MAG: HAMP domain-containing histidine kinase [Oscillospiraceae bacterium]|nr:HAMP domain-containing histidine kinase [Oscillospiraceae bacterium]
MKHKRGLGHELWTFAIAFIIFFLLCAFIVTCSFLLFFSWFDLPEDQIRASAPITFTNTLLLTFIFVLLDRIRRNKTVEQPVNEIQSALKKITAGDFSVRLDDKGNYLYSGIINSINRMTEELSGVETLRTDFISNVSHELKTPLAVIRNYGTLLQKPDLSDEKRVEYATAITEASGRLSDLITNILKLNRLENQQIYPVSEPFDLGEQLCECLLQFESVWEKNNIQIETDLTPDTIVHADKELLSLVWNNLLSNAFKFTDPGGTVTVTVTQDDKYALVAVRDTGCGISPEVGPHIFEKFYQGDTSHATAGNGLGLALVKRIMDITNGTVSVSSTPNVGTVFTVKIQR